MRRNWYDEPFHVLVLTAAAWVWLLPLLLLFPSAVREFFADGDGE